MKEVIFHFFPPVRFLGLSLKILFHKNKEIKRMLSKKMTVSLMSLITLLAFAFVAPSVMAVDFEVMIEGPKVVTYETGSSDNDVDDEIEIDLIVTSEEALLEPLTIGTVDADDADALDPEGDAPNITGEVRDNRGFITTLWGDPRVTIVDTRILLVEQ